MNVVYPKEQGVPDPGVYVWAVVIVLVVVTVSEVPSPQSITIF
jgi:hypothetical protein